MVNKPLASFGVVPLEPIIASYQHPLPKYDQLETKQSRRALKQILKIHEETIDAL